MNGAGRYQPFTSQCRLYNSSESCNLFLKSNQKPILCTHMPHLPIHHGATGKSTTSFGHPIGHCCYLTP